MGYVSSQNMPARQNHRQNCSHKVMSPFLPSGLLSLGSEGGTEEAGSGSTPNVVICVPRAFSMADPPIEALRKKASEQDSTTGMPNRFNFSINPKMPS